MTNVKYSVAASKGTSSLLACLAPLGIGYGINSLSTEEEIKTVTANIGEIILGL